MACPVITEPHLWKRKHAATDQLIAAGEAGFKDIPAEGREDGPGGREAALRDKEACEWHLEACEALEAA